MTNDSQNNSPILTFEETQTLLEAKLDGDVLSLEENETLLASISFYPALNAYYQSATQVLDGLKNIQTMSDLGTDFTDKVMNQIAEQSKPAQEQASQTKRLLQKPLLQWSALAAAVALMVMMIGLPMFNVSPHHKPLISQQSHIEGPSVQEKYEAPVLNVNLGSTPVQTTVIQRDVNTVKAPVVASASLASEEEVFVAQVTGVTHELVPESDVWTSENDPIALMVGF